MTNYIRDLYLCDILTNNERKRAYDISIKGAGLFINATPNMDEALETLIEALCYDSLEDMAEDFSEVEHYYDEVHIEIGDVVIIISLDNEIPVNDDNLVDDYLYELYSQLT